MPTDASSLAGVVTAEVEQPASPEGPVDTFLSSSEFLGNYRKYGESKNRSNQPHEPFKSLYEARDILSSLRNSLAQIEDDNEKELKALSLAVFDHHLGVLHIQTEERSAGEKALTSSLAVLRAHASNPAYAHVVVDALNQLGVLWSDWGRAVAHLQEAEGFYHLFKRGGGGVPVVDILDKESQPSEEDRWKSFEDLHTHSLFYLAQVYGLLELKDKSAEYCRMTLKRQLRSKDFNKLTWALDCMNLSQYYTSMSAYPQAHHCLTAAEQMLSTIDSSALAKAKAEADGTAVEENPLARAEADLAWIWGSFYLEALKTSVERYVDNDAEETSGENEDSEELSNHIAALSLFDELEVKPTRPQIPPNYATSSDEAKKLFLEGVGCLEKAKRFFVIDGYVTDHANIIQAMSQLYKCLSAFEKDPLRCSKLIKRRADLLTPLLAELSPHHYLDLMQSIMYELAAVYEALVDARLNAWERTAESKVYDERVKDALEINELVTKAIKFYTDFIASYADPTTKMLPEPFTDSDDVRAVMTARWRVARLWARMLPVPSDPSKAGEKDLRDMKANWLRKSYEQYERICNYDTRQGIPDYDAELRVIREMRALVPVQIREVMEGF